MTAKHITYYTDDTFSVLGDQQRALYVHTQDSAVCVPLTDTGMVIFIVEPSPIDDGEILMLPAGTVGIDIPPQEAASHVLRDTIGYHPGQLNTLGQLRPWVKHFDMLAHVYLAKQLIPSTPASSLPSQVSTQFVDLSNFERLVVDGRLQDATFIAALYLARRYINGDQTCA